jgi:hypothetical protein
METKGIRSEKIEAASKHRALRALALAERQKEVEYKYASWEHIFSNSLKSTRVASLDGSFLRHKVRTR